MRYVFAIENLMSISGPLVKNTLAMSVSFIINLKIEDYMTWGSIFLWEKCKRNSYPDYSVLNQI